MPELTPEENANRRNILKVQTAVEVQINQTIEQIFRSAGGLKLVNDTWNLKDHPLFLKKLNEALKNFRINVEAILVNGIKESFDISQRNFISSVYSAYDGRKINEPVKALINQKYNKILQAFIKRSEGSLKLSDRIWNLSYQLQREIEWTIFAGLSEGQSAATMARSIKRFLRNPDALYRRVRNAKGKLVLSKPARQFKPGQGVYRSAYKNSMRLARTEVNTANRTADHEKFKSIPFVLGIEIRLSDAHVIYDICDIVAGVYPSWFKFTMWHPQCICYSVPILASKEEFDRYQQAVLSGNDGEFKFKNVIKDPPKQFFNWIEENRERVNGWKNLPVFISDNPRFKTLLE